MFDFNNGSIDDQSTVSRASKMDANQMPTVQRSHVSVDNTKEAEASTIWCVRHLPQNRNFFATCDGSGNVRVWHR